MSGRVGLSRNCPPKRKTNDDAKDEDDSRKSPRVETQQQQQQQRPAGSARRFVPPTSRPSAIQAISGSTPQETQSGVLRRGVATGASRSRSPTYSSMNLQGGRAMSNMPPPAPRTSFSLPVSAITGAVYRGTLPMPGSALRATIIPSPTKMPPPPPVIPALTLNALRFRSWPAPPTKNARLSLPTAKSTISGEFPDSPPLDERMLSSPERKAADSSDEELPLSPIVGYRYDKDGKVVKPSALEKAMMEDYDEEITDKTDFAKKEQEERDKDMNALKIALDPNMSKEVHEGFTTASGKPVKVSEAALKKVKAMFDPDELNLLTIHPTSTAAAPAPAANSNANTADDKEVLECMEAFLQDGDDF